MSQGREPAPINVVELGRSPLPVDAGSQGSSAAWSDSVGMIASIACAIHCAAMPFVIAYLPSLGLSFLADESFHQWMAVACFFIALTAFVPGLRKHKRLTPVIVGSVGLVLISTAAFGFAGECCVACEANANSEANLASQANASTEATALVACDEECCSLCSAEIAGISGLAQDAPDDFVAAETKSASVGPGASALVDAAVPWLTPLGGLILVTAHLLNRRYGCLCGCCDVPATA